MLLNTYTGIYKALVSNVSDPDGLNRIRVQCPQVSSLAEIQWAYPANPNDPVPTVGSVIWITFSGGDLTKPVYYANSSYITLRSDKESLQILSLSDSVNNDPTIMFLVPGPDGSASGGGNSPHVTIRDRNTSTPVDFHLSGAAFKVNTDGTFINWQTPSYATNWQGTTGGVSPALRFRLDMEDNLVVIGSVTANAGFATGTNTFATIPAAFRPNANWGVPCLHTTSGNVNVDSIQFRVTSSGNLQFASSTITSGDRFLISATIPLGNLS